MLLRPMTTTPELGPLTVQARLMFKGVKQSVIRGELPIIQSLEHGYSQSVEEGNVQLGGAVGNFGGNILGGIAMGAAFGGGATIETGITVTPHLITKRLNLR